MAGQQGGEVTHAPDCAPKKEKVESFTRDSSQASPCIKVGNVEGGQEAPEPINL